MYHQIYVEDKDTTDLISHFTVCIAFIEGAFKNNEASVLVHWYVCLFFLLLFLFIHHINCTCSAAGISRSSTIVIAYVILYVSIIYFPPLPYSPTLPSTRLDIDCFLLFVTFTIF